MAQADSFAAAIGPGPADPLGVLRPVQAPWVRPGVVVHDPNETIDGLLAHFALALRQRGFNVVGYVQRNNRGCTGNGEGCADHIEYFDLGTSETLSVERDAGIKYLRRAMREDADLVIISRFVECLKATQNVGASVGADALQGLPLLTSIAGQCIRKWHSYMRHDGAMVSPDIESLWRWWGPDHLYQDLAQGVAEDDVLRIVCGARWIMVEGPNGTGLAYLPRHPRELLPRLRYFQSHSLKTLASLSRSWDPLEFALGAAAMNAHYNRYDLEANPGNGAARLRGGAGRVVVIGAFPGLDGVLPNRAVIEADPRPGDFPTVAMDNLLPGPGAAVVNSSAFINRSLPRILRLAQKRRVALVGPSTPMTPRLFDYGLAVLGGLVVNNPNGLADAIRSGATPKEFNRVCRYAHIVRH